MTARRFELAPLPATDAARYADRNSKPNRGHPAFLTHWPDSIGGCVSRPSFSTRTARANAAVPASSQRRGTSDQKRVKPSSTTARSGQAAPASGRRGLSAEHLPRHTAKPKSKFAAHPSESLRKPVARADAQRQSVTTVPHEGHTKNIVCPCPNSRNKHG